MSSQRMHKFSSPSSSPKISVPSSHYPLYPEGDRLPSPSPAMSGPSLQLPPGFRFHPTDEELILHYLRNRTTASPCPVSIISEVDIYKFDPWDLPGKAAFGDREWYFFSPRDRKYPNGIRPNRAAASGYWKATGTDKPICSGNENIGVKKALVFYKGRPPKGIKTNWIMHEYRLSDSHGSNTYKPIKLRDHSMRLDDWVLCRIYMKSSHLLPAMIDEQPEEPFRDDIRFPTPHHRTLSTAEFPEDYSPLSNIFSNQPELPRFDGGNSLISHHLLCQSLLNQAREGTGNSYLLPPLSHAESPVTCGAKRQRMADCNAEESSATFQSLKKHNEIYPNFSGQFDMSQPFLLNQQLLMNSQLGNLQ